MQVSGASQRERGPSDGAGPGAQPHTESRNGTTGSGVMSKAERFENEKKRIIESCFARKDSDGSGASRSRPSNPRHRAQVSAVFR